MVKQHDLRYIRTQKLIQEAFFELMETIGFDKITVRAITEKAMINRSTFYLHYMDKYELLNRLENEMLEQLKSIYMKIPTDSFLSKTFKIEELDIILTKVFQYIRYHSRFFLLMIHREGNSDFFGKLNDVVKELIQPNISFLTFIDIPEKYLAAIISETQTTIIKQWLSSKMAESPEELAKIVSNLIMYFIQGVNISN